MTDTREELLARVKGRIDALMEVKEDRRPISLDLLRDLAAFLATPTPEEVADVIKALETEYRTMSKAAEAAAVMLDRLSRDLAAFLATPTPEERLAECEAEIARKDEALKEIAAQVIGDCPTALFDPEFPEGWAIRRFSELRAMASAALARAPKETPA